MEIFGFNPVLFWFVLGFVFLVAEAVTPGTFLLFFGLGAWVVSGLSYFVDVEAWAQWLMFAVISIASLVLFRSRLKHFFEGRLSKPHNLPDTVVTGQYIGKEVLVVADLAPGKPGLVELHGTNWQARTEGPPIYAGQRARVLALEGLTLVVEAVVKH